LRGKSTTGYSTTIRSGRKAFYVIEAGFVTTDDGTGIVHMAPAYGEDDYQASKKYGLPTIHPVNRSGEFGPDVPDFAGKFVKDADLDIIRVLKERHILYRKETITHSYPHCWRCKTPLLYYARDSWYISTTKYAKRMIELNREITWVPPEIGEGRFGNWLEENKDWALSRDRFWGTPLPIWVCEKCGALKCVGSVAEYREGRGVKEPLDLHKPFVDDVTFDCSCGGRCGGYRSLSTSGSIPGPCRSRSGTTRSRTGRSSIPAKGTRLISSAKESTRRAAGFIPCMPSARFSSTGPRTGRSWSMSSSWTRPARRCPSRWGTPSTPSRSWRTTAPTRRAGTW
jgi:hypothetical protein